MGIETKSTELTNEKGDSVKIETTQFLSSQGVELQAKIVRMIIPVAGVALGSTNSNKSILDQDFDIGKITETLMLNFTEKKVLGLIMEIISLSRLDGKELGKKEIFDIEFAGDYMLLFNTVKFALEANFGDFFGENGIGKYISKYIKKIPINLEEK